MLPGGLCRGEGGDEGRGWGVGGGIEEQMVCGNADFQTTAPYLSQLLDRYEP